MKRIIIVFSFLVFGSECSLGQNWVWGRQGNLINSGDGSEGWAVATDLSGNGYLVGYYSGDTLIFGPDTLVYLQGTFETFLVKYSPAGNVLWANQSATPSFNSYGYGFSVATDKSENCLITGLFKDTISFGAYTLITPFLNGYNVFLTKYDSTGILLWAKQSLGASVHSTGYGESVCTDKNNNIFLTGIFQDTISFDAFRLIAKSGNTGIFIVKYDSNGNVRWAKQNLDTLNESNGGGYGIASDKKGNIYITGNFNDTVYFGAYKLSSINSYENNGDVFLVKYNSVGNVIWAKQAVLASDNSFGNGLAVTTDKFYNIYITGRFRDTISIGSTQLISKSVFPYDHDFFVAKYDSNGNNIWAETAQILDSTQWAGYALSIDTNENIYVTTGGVFGGTHNYRIVFWEDTFKTYIGGEDGASLIMKLDTSGKLLCGTIVAGGGDDNNGIAVDPSGKNVYFGGDLWNDTLIFNIDTLQDPPYHEFPFMAKWQPCNVDEGIKPISSQKYSVCLFPNPNNGTFTLSLSNVNEKSAGGRTSCNVEIYNVLGEKVLTETLRSAQGDNTINLTGQPNGIYLYRLITEDGSLVGEGKVIIAK